MANLKETPLKERFLNTFFITLGMALCGYPMALIAVETFLKPVIVESHDEFFSVRLSLIYVFFSIFTLIPVVLFLIQGALKLITHRNFPVKIIPTMSKKVKIIISICFIVLVGYMFAPGDLFGLIGLLPFLGICYVLGMVWLLKKLIENYALKWTIMSFVFASFLFFLFYLSQHKYFYCPSERPLYSKLRKCHSCDEIGYFYSKNCSICPNRMEIDGKCYLK